jgi:hypothetical protein
VAIALAGFASVIAALGRPLGDLARQRFFSLLALSLIQVLGCLLPLWCLRWIDSPATAWRLLSLTLLVLNLARIWWLVLVPNRRLGPEVGVVVTPNLSRATYATAIAGFVCLGVNAIGIPFDPNFELYYTGQLTTLLVGFVLFADVATRES